MMFLPNEIHECVNESIGDYEVIKNYRKDSLRTRVWKIKSFSTHNEYFVKTHLRKSRWHPEVFAYKNWIQAILPYAPKLIEVYEKANWQGILITALDGNTMTESHLSKEQEEKAYYKAGELTNIFHTKFKGDYFGRPDCNGKPIDIFHHFDPVQYMKKNFCDLHDDLSELNCLDSKVLSLINWSLDNIDVLTGTNPVPISWDSSPYNWLVNHNGEFIGMIDFENMLWGVPSDSFTILFERYFKESGNSKYSFFDGYGFDKIKSMKTQIKISCVKMAIADIIYGIDKKDERVYNLGKQMINSIDELSSIY